MGDRHGAVLWLVPPGQFSVYRMLWVGIELQTVGSTRTIVERFSSQLGMRLGTNVGIPIHDHVVVFTDVQLGVLGMFGRQVG